MAARKDALEAKLAAVRALRADPSGPDTRAALRSALTDKSSHVVAAAAHHLTAHPLEGFGDALVAAYERFPDAARDPGCAAKIAIVQALAALDHPDPDPHLHAVRHVQLEKAWGPPVDTAAGLRGPALAALVGLSHPEFPVLAGEMLADPEARCRGAAAQALAAWGDADLGSALLRLRIRAGEDEPEVLADCFASLLALGGRAAVDHLTTQLAGDTLVAESAALALGSARVASAFPALRAWVEGRADPRSRRVGYVAVGLLRTEEALEWLLAALRQAGPRDREGLDEALAVYEADPAAAARIAAARGRA